MEMEKKLQIAGIIVLLIGLIPYQLNLNKIVMAIIIIVGIGLSLSGSLMEIRKGEESET